MKDFLKTVLAAGLGAALYGTCVPQARGAPGWSITESAHRIADAVERMANCMEKK